MTKKEVQKRVLKKGKPLDLDKFEWDEKTKTFSTKECSLVIDFSGEFYCTFKTGSNCMFKTGSNCTFKTGSNCTFKTWSNCTFKTWSNCTFDTGSNCTFDTWSNCTFKTGSNCTFKTGYDCTFDTGVFCVVVRRDVYEVIELEEGVKIKLNSYKMKGYKKAEDYTVEVTANGKTVRISEESAKALGL